MGKIYKIEKSRKEYTCSRCGKKIEKGQPYLRGELNFSKPIIRCPKCGLQHWEVTTSEYQLNVGEIVYRWNENYEVSEDGRDNIISDLEEIKDELQDRLDNMPEGLQQGDTGCLLQARIDSLDGAIYDLESIDFDDDNFDDDVDEEDRICAYRDQIDDALSNIEM